jgi:hypothetical protein
MSAVFTVKSYVGWWDSVIDDRRATHICWVSSRVPPNWPTFISSSATIYGNGLWSRARRRSLQLALPALPSSWTSQTSQLMSGVPWACHSKLCAVPEAWTPTLIKWSEALSGRRTEGNKPQWIDTEMSWGSGVDSHLCPPRTQRELG